MDHITEPGRSVPVAHEADVCVIGGSCTGVFAAVRAAQLGLRVALVERRSMLGGMATTAQVTHWHSVYDAAGEKRIIGGLLDVVLERLVKANALVELPKGGRVQYKFHPHVLACELEQLLAEHGVRLFLESVCSVPIMDGRRVEAVVLEDRSGRRAIRAAMFIDATGDGDLLRRAGFQATKAEALQPVSYQMLVRGLDAIREHYGKVDLWKETRDLAQQYGFPDSNPWIDLLAGVSDVQNIFGPRLSGYDASDPDQLTEATIEGRRCARAFLSMIREQFPEAAHKVAPVAMAQALGVRETWHAVCQHRLTRDELLRGERFDDAIANGTYPVDVHSPDGCRLMYLDGRESFVAPDGEIQWKRWRDEDAPTPRCYHIPLRSLIPKDAVNLLVAGRLIDADRDAYGAVRVMVNCNQTGEAAGVAAAVCLDTGSDVARAPAHRVREQLAEGGSIIHD